VFRDLDYARLKRSFDYFLGIMHRRVRIDSATNE
jgi:hypothetical protein